ncbi:nicotinate-nucleotide diphosphorylase (carboxylating) [Malassezia japonica]|uniref:Nicotinate-nucleotide pyrophosphorylase [carboxylating] n=1 Tax=Malassezia japonica TaxID=223818 RepID=A0AAF0J969_9BASI|nr:nicotinate-nucleotide diphosphorylase (carboxylating) [Malassezia japonica]WFD37815.1 nicotinate-nucleotide diphosphorylase (carboxylating) [Malassezia japonica]
MSAPKYADLLPPSWKTTVTAWLEEDCPSFDWGGYVVGEAPRSATLLCKDEGVLAGVPFVNAVFAELGCTVSWNFEEGHFFTAADNVPGTPAGKVKVAAAHVKGPTRNLLLGERVALNTLARCSGIATASRRLLDAARAANYRGIVAGTRKTTPGFRLVEKYGMIVGGVDAHRYDLSSMVMLKDNHVWSTGSITNAVRTARSAAGFSLRIDVEVQSFEEAEEAIRAGADVVMLDNMVGDVLVDCAKTLKEKLGTEHRFLLESSGGITLSNLAEESHIDNAIDIISTSAIHQSTQHVDFSLKIDH